jgi:hypothetical protein
MVTLVLWMIAAGVIVVVFMAITMLAARSVVVSVDGHMIMVVIVIVIVTMAVMMGLRGVALGLHIGAAFGIERRLERDHASPETLGHRLDDGVAADAQRLWHDFGRQMTVAEVPGDAGQGQWVCGPGRAGIRARRCRSWRRAGDSAGRSRAPPYPPERPTNGRPG